MLGHQPYHKEHVNVQVVRGNSRIWRVNGSIVDETSGPIEYSSINSVDGYRNPYWREEVAKGHQAGTSFEGFSMLDQRLPSMHCMENWDTVPPYQPGPYWGTGKYHAANYFDSWLTSHDPSTLDETKANNEALIHFVDKVRDVQTSFQGGVFLGELKESVEIIRNPARAIRRGFDSFLSGAKKLGPRIRNLPLTRRRDILADTWLEYSFGWKPLYNDFHEGLKTFAESNVVKTGLWKAVQGVGQDEIVVNHDSATFGNTVPTYSGRVRRKSKVTIRYKGQVDRALNAVYDAQNMGVDLHSVPLAAWEIVPWSFLIDYFTNIGDIISAATIARSDIRWILKTVRKEYISDLVEMKTVGTGSSTYQTRYIASAYLRNRPMIRKHVVRSRYNDSLVPSLEFSIPGLGNKWLNMAALYTGRSNLRSMYLT